ncbi:MAG: hypothetical protein ACI867_001818 [Glaciecola sp.]|jgi:hypothetical protein
MSAPGVGADPVALRDGAAMRDHADHQIPGLARRIETVFAAYRRGAVDFASCLRVEHGELANLGASASTLNDWARAIARGFEAADGGAPDSFVPGEMYGRFATLAEQERWDTGIQASRRVHKALDLGDEHAAEVGLLAILDLGETEQFAALCDLGDIDEVHERLQQAHQDMPLLWRFGDGVAQSLYDTVDVAMTLGAAASGPPMNDSMVEVAMSLLGAVRHPIETLKAGIGVQGFKRDTIHWAGGLVPALVAAVLTAGTSASVRGATGAGRLARPIAHLKDLQKGLKPVPDVLQARRGADAADDRDELEDRSREVQESRR